MGTDLVAVGCDGAVGQAAAVITAAALAALAGEYWPALWSVCALDRDALLAGQVWRLWSGHLMHLDLRHAGVNLAMLAVILVFAARWRVLVSLLLTSTLLMPLLALALLLSRPDLHWYVGLSGLLHGWVVWLLLVRAGWLAWLGAVLVAVKLVWQAFDGVEPWIVQEAHWLGGVLGAVLAWPARHWLSVKRREVSAMH